MFEEREGRIEQVQFWEKRRMDMEGLGYGQEKKVLDRLRLERRSGCIGQVQVKERRRMNRTGTF